MISMLKRVWIGVVASGVLTAFPFVVHAQQRPSESQNQVSIVQQAGLQARGDFDVSPPRSVVEMSPGETRVVDLALTSHEGEPRTYSVGTEDFSMADDETNVIQFHGTSDGPFSARHWIALPTQSISLLHGERATIPVRISVPANAAPGDRQSVVVFRRDPKASASDKSSLIARAGALIFVTVKGGDEPSGELKHFTPSSSVSWSLPVRFFLQFRNTGEVHAVPSGEIEIRNVFGMNVDTLPVSSWYVLRNSTRSQEIRWRPAFALGHYTATLHLQASENSASETRAVSFWVVPVFSVLTVLLSIFIVSFLIQAVLSHRVPPKKRKKR